MNSTSRIIQEAYNSALDMMGLNYKTCDLPGPESLKASRVIQNAGSHTIVNPVEAAFYKAASAETTYSWSEAKFYHLRNVALSGDQGQVFLKDGSLFLPSIYPHQERLHKVKVRRPIRFGATTFEGPVFHLTGRNHDNRGHFLLQHMPRILAARSILSNYPDYRILVAPGHAKWQKNLLKMMGFDPERVIEGSRGTQLIEDLLFVPFHYGSNALNAPHYYKEIRDCAAALCVNDQPESSIFVSRSDAPDKRLINEDRIVEIAREVLGPLEVIHLGKFSLPEQIAKFRKAPIILAPIGQGACNIVFAENRLLATLAPGKSISELYGGGHSTHPAIICGNKALTMLSGVSVTSRGNWEYPEDHFRRDINFLMNLPELSQIRQMQADLGLRTS
jgi:hypothetical protein